MERTLEPEVMDNEAQALAYAAADFSSSNQMFVDGFVDAHASRLARVLDIGCGPADIPIRLARARPLTHVTAVDASDAMVTLARKAVGEAGLCQRIDVIKGRIPGLHLPVAPFDAIISKDLLHHLPDPMVFWAEVIRLGPLAKALYVMDLFRPETTEQAETIVESVSGGEPEILKRDFFNSLRAAFTPGEIEDQLRRAALALHVEVVSDRHVLVTGVVE